MEIVLNMCIIVMKENIQNNPPYFLPIKRERGRERETKREKEANSPIP